MVGRVSPHDPKSGIFLPFSSPRRCSWRPSPQPSRDEPLDAPAEVPEPGEASLGLDGGAGRRRRAPRPSPGPLAANKGLSPVMNDNTPFAFSLSSLNLRQSKASKQRRARGELLLRQHAHLLMAPVLFISSPSCSFPRSLLLLSILCAYVAPRIDACVS